MTEFPFDGALPMAAAMRSESFDIKIGDEARPRPKWWLLHATNYLVMGIFVGSVIYQLRRQTSWRLQRDASSLLPMLLVWSCCMAYFFGFFGISFVDKDEDLSVYDVVGSGPAEARSLDEWRRVVLAARGERLPPVPEEGDALATESSAAPLRRRVERVDSGPHTPSWAQVVAKLRHERDAARVAAVEDVGDATPVGPLLVCGAEAVVPLVRATDDARRLADKGLNALRLCGGVRTTAEGGREGKTTASCCIATTGAAEATSVAAAAHKAGVRAALAGRCVFVEVDCDDSNDAGSARKAARRACAMLAQAARVRNAQASAVAVARVPDAGAVVVEATLPGPVVRRALGASVADVCAADTRSNLAASAAMAEPQHADLLAPWRSRHHAQDVLDALAVAVGVPLPPVSRAGRLVVEAVNHHRDLHVSLAAPALARLPSEAAARSLLGLVHDHAADDRRLRLDCVAAALVLAVDLADLADRALPGANSRARCG